MALTGADILGVEPIGFNTGTTLDTLCNVPSGCGAIAVLHSRFGGATNTFSATVGGNAANDVISVTAAVSSIQYGALFPGLAAGEHAFQAAGVDPTSGDASNVVIVYLSTNVSSDAFRAKNALTDDGAQADAKTFTLSGLTAGDLALQLDVNTPTVQAAPGLPAGWSNVYSLAGNNANIKGQRVSAIVVAGTTRSFASQPTLSWSGLTGVVLAPASGGSTTKDLAAGAASAAAAAANAAVAKILGALAQAQATATAAAAAIAKTLGGAAAGQASATGQLLTGTLTTPALKNNTGTLLANEVGATVHVYALGGALVVTKTAQTTNAAGVMTINDAAIAAGTTYRVVVVLASGAEGMDKLVAS